MKKQFISVVLTLTMSLGSMPFICAESRQDYYNADFTNELTYGQYGENGEWWINSDAKIEKKYEEQELSFPKNSNAELNIDNNEISIKAKSTAGTKFITAIYDKNGVMKKTDIRDGAESLDFSIAAPPDMEIETVKCFQWENLINMTPISDAIVSEKGYGGQPYLQITNNDTNASVSANDVACDLLDLPPDTEITKEIAEQAKEALTEKRAKGTVNNGLFSNKIKVSTQSTQIEFTVRFDDLGGFIELSNSTAYGPYINTDAGNITVNTGYQNTRLLENINLSHWYKFTLILHDGREDNPVASCNITVKDISTGEENTLENIGLMCRKADWYKVNFFPASAYGKTVSLKAFSVRAYEGDTPDAAPIPSHTPYPTLKPTPSPSPLPGGETPRPTIVPQIQKDAASKNKYTFHDDFDFYEKSVGKELNTDNFSVFAVKAVTEKDSTNNKFVTISNSASGQRYYTTADTATRLITTKAITEFKVKFNAFQAKDSEMCTFDLLSGSGDNQKSDDSKLVVALRFGVDKTGNMYVVNSDGNKNFASVAASKWYTLKVVTDVQAQKNSITIYDGDDRIGEINDVAFYHTAAAGIKNFRLTSKRDSGKISLDDVYISEMLDDETPVFEDTDGEKAPMTNFLASYGIAQPKADKSFEPTEEIRADEFNEMIFRTTNYSTNITHTTRENAAKELVNLYKELSGDNEPVKAQLEFTDQNDISDKDMIAEAVGLSLTFADGKGAFEPTKNLTRYEALLSVSRLLTAVNIGITGKIEPVPTPEIKAPHVIDLLPETGVIRDPMVNLSPDGYYYMCCSTGTAPDQAKGDAFPREDTSDEDLWKDDTGIRIWRSSDLVDWTPVKSGKTDSEYPFYIWNVYENGTWEKINGFGVSNINNGEQRFAQVLWAPEIHWVKGTYFIEYCMNPGGTAIARSVTGKPEGPYVRQECSQNKPFKNRIDASMFWDDDNTVYYTDGSCAIWQMNDDMTDIARKSDGTEIYIASQAPGKEGGFLFKHNGIYYATAGEFFSGRYDAVIGMNKTGKCLSKGAYGEVHYLYTCGHNGYFEDKDGNWWATMFGNDNDPLANSTNGFNNGFALIPIDFDEYDGHVYVNEDRLTAWNNLLQERGYHFNK